MAGAMSGATVGVAQKQEPSDQSQGYAPREGEFIRVWVLAT